MNNQRVTKGQQKQINWDDLSFDLINNHEQYHHYYYSLKNFTGPSHYFHIRALNASESEKVEMIYAVLVSWGMHRMGGGAQMNDYPVFSATLSSELENLHYFNGRILEDITDAELALLKPIFYNLNPMKSSKKVVAISKIFAHIIPNIIAPIDNEYTYQFINGALGKTTAPRNWPEFELLKEIHLKVFKPVVSDTKFKASAAFWLNNNEFPWDTSLPKIVDNLIVGKIGQQKKMVVQR